MATDEAESRKRCSSRRHKGTSTLNEACADEHDLHGQTKVQYGATARRHCRSLDDFHCLFDMPLHPWIGLCPFLLVCRRLH